MKIFTAIVVMLALSLQLYSQDCLRKFGGIRWIEKRLELDKYNSHIKNINRDSNLECSKDRFAMYELILEDEILVTYRIEGCDEITITLKIIFNGVNIDYGTVISTTHLMSTLFSLPDDRILEIDTSRLLKNSELLNIGERLTINTMMIGGYDKHETSFQKLDDKFKVDVVILETYIVGD